MTLLRTASAQQLVNIDTYAPGGVYASGAAVLGAGGDQWNELTTGPNGTTTNLVDSTGSPTTLSITVSGAGGRYNRPSGQFGFPTSDATVALLGDYFSQGNGASITVTLAGLDTSAAYHLAVYGAGLDTGNAGLYSGGVSGLIDGSTRLYYSLGHNYLDFPVVVPAADGTLTYAIAPPVSGGGAIFGGLQIQTVPTSVVAPTITAPPASQTVRSGQPALLSFSVDSGSLPFTTQW